MWLLWKQPMWGSGDVSFQHFIVVWLFVWFDLIWLIAMAKGGEARRAVLISLVLFVIPCHGQATQDDATGSGELGKRGLDGPRAEPFKKTGNADTLPVLRDADGHFERPADGADVRPEEGPLLKQGLLCSKLKTKTGVPEHQRWRTQGELQGPTAQTRPLQLLKLGLFEGDKEGWVQSKDLWPELASRFCPITERCRWGAQRPNGRSQFATGLLVVEPLQLVCEKPLQHLMMTPG
jgi:hypothetical protein